MANNTGFKPELVKQMREIYFSNPELVEWQARQGTEPNRSIACAIMSIAGVLPEDLGA